MFTRQMFQLMKLKVKTVKNNLGVPITVKDRKTGTALSSEIASGAFGVVKMTVSLYLTPIVGVVFAAVFLGERVTRLEIIGGCVILVGVALATKVKGGGK